LDKSTLWGGIKGIVMSEIKTLNCGCEVIEATNGSVMLTYCPKHKVAPDLYEALRHSTTIIHNQIRYEVGEHREYLQKQLKTNLEILAKAEGK